MIKIVFDTETTGVDLKKDKIIEFAFVKYEDDKLIQEDSFLINPGMIIPADSIAIHNITNEEVAEKPPFSHYAKEIVELFADVDLIVGYNVRFDINFLRKELLECGHSFDVRKYKVIDPFLIFAHFNPRDLKGACKHYLNKEFSEGHRALTDTKMTQEVLAAQTIKHDLNIMSPDVEDYATPILNICDVEARFIFDKEKQLCFNFGNNRGKRIDIGDEKMVGYLQWMLRSDFAKDTKNICKAAVQGYAITPENIAQIMLQGKQTI